jgi:hypothetical protein
MPAGPATTMVEGPESPGSRHSRSVSSSPSRPQSLRGMREEYGEWAWV